ncbi:MAG TPA: tetratricopeptide repeat protein [Usitatibacter sp.]|nr:tetratricopeptide repeat protein [Usitatibacter sp.]
MSLLLDALKRAEQEKLTRQSDRPPEPVPRVVPAAQLAAQVLELQPLTSAASAAGASAAPRTDAQLAQAVFKAKAGAEPKSRRRILWAAAGVIALVAIAVGIYFWHSVNALAPHRQPLAAPRPAPIAPAPVASPQPGAAPADAATKASGAERKPPAESGLPAAASHGEAKRESTPVEDLLKQPQPAVAPPVQLARDTGEPKPRVAPAVDAGYRALLAGDLAAARRHYAAAVEADSTSVDAQLGLATVEARTGNVAGAARAYRRALELDPRNATALAGLAALAENAPPEALENDLSGEIAQHPDSAALELTLGNLYASQRRWTDAQAAFFEAERLQPENADIAYNLAVSLDHLGQRRAAADFYRRALELRAHEGAQFDAAAASRRLAELAR